MAKPETVVIFDISAMIGYACTMVVMVIDFSLLYHNVISVEEKLDKLILEQNDQKVFGGSE